MPAQKVSPISTLSLPLALRDAGDPDLYSEYAERNVQEIYDMAVSINKNLIPGINAAVTPLNTVIDNLTAVQNAAGNADAAIKKAGEAAASAKAAADSAKASAGSATTAGTKATAAATSAGSASTKAGEAAASATTAATQAGIATTKAGEAAGSATASAGSAKAAADSATAASAAKTGAESAKTAAETAEGNAKTAKIAAETAQTNALASEQAAEEARAGAERARDAAQSAVTEGIPDATTAVRGLVKYGTSAGTAAQGNHGHPAQTTVSGNAGSATKLATARTFAVSGDITCPGVAFDGSGNATLKAAVTERAQALGNISGAVGLNCAAGLYIAATVTAAATLNVAAAPAGGCATLLLELTNGGKFAVTWGMAPRWSNGVAPVLTAAGVDLVALTYRGGKWIGALVASNVK